ncbi:MAG: DUF362 domain-containing protein [Draconibacterium sp.]
MKETKFSFVDKIKRARLYLLRKPPFKPFFLITGLLASIWFLIRVVPKPSRAGYPCMRAAAPFMSGFVIYLLSLTSSLVLFQKLKVLLERRKYLASLIVLFAVIITGTLVLVSQKQQPAFASMPGMNEPPDGANNPMGEEQGIMPGRVVWAWNPDATNANCDNKPGNTYWKYQNNDTAVIRGMVTQSILELSGESNLKGAWDAVFANFNQKKHGEARGYRAGEKIFVKINQGTASWLLTVQEKAAGFKITETSPIQPSWREAYYAATETGPFVVLNILRQLINVEGVAQEDIFVGDPMSNIYHHNFSVWYNEFPDVKYVDKTTEDFHRYFIFPAIAPTMHYSDGGSVLKEEDESYFEEMEAADYLINVACLKAHVRAGVTLCAKNHFGSITRSGAGHLHPGLVSTSDNGLDQSNTGYKKYRVLVDIMGHKYLGQNTMLFIVEGLYGGDAVETKGPRKWNMPPFNGNWSSSIFMSLDQVALESVCYDFLRTEFNGVNQPENYPNWEGVDDYLHQAASSDNWPNGFTYNPDGEGALKSLGVHEHWNSSKTKQYSRNLGGDYGIELKQISGTSVSAQKIASQDFELQTYPNPFTGKIQISFNIKQPSQVKISMFDLNGRLIETLGEKNLEIGNHKFQWNVSGKNLKQGNYVIKLFAQTGGEIFQQSKTVQLVNNNR